MENQQQPKPMDQAPQKASQVVDQAQQKVSQVADQAKQMTGEVVQQAQETAMNQIDQGKGRVAETVGMMAEAMRKSSQYLQEQDQGMFGHTIEQAAQRLENFGTDLQNKSVDEIINGVERFARRDPQLFLGGAVVLGLLASRFMKASGGRNQRRQMQNRPYGQAPYGQGSYGRPYSQGSQWQQNQPGYARQGPNASAGMFGSTYDPGHSPETGISSTPDYTQGTMRPRPNSAIVTGSSTLPSQSPVTGAGTPATNKPQPLTGSTTQPPRSLTGNPDDTANPRPNDDSGKWRNDK